MRGSTPAASKMARVFRRLHEARGARFAFGERLAAFEGEGAVRAGLTTTGDRHEADMVVCGIGVEPDVRLAADAGLEVEGGVVVDGTLCTSDPAIWAVGDCSVYPDARSGVRLRPESIQTATDQARAVVASMLGGTEPYDAVPWFWTMQCGVKLQIAGIPRPGMDTVLTGAMASDPEATSGSLLGYEHGCLICVESLQAAGDHLAARTLLASGAGPEPEAARAEGFSLKAWAKAR